jgi:hypothetical protein
MMTTMLGFCAWAWAGLMMLSEVTASNAAQTMPASFHFIHDPFIDKKSTSHYQSGSNLTQIKMIEAKREVYLTLVDFSVFGALGQEQT